MSTSRASLRLVGKAKAPAKAKGAARADRPASALTPRQQAFVDAYAGNATEAAIAAGYSRQTARAQGSRLLTNADIREAIEARRSKSSERLIATREDRQRFWTEVLRDVGSEMRDRLKASELLGKSEADFTEKVEHSGVVAVNVVDPYAGGEDG